MIRALLLVLALAFALLLAQDTPAQECPELPFNVLVPFNYPCPIMPRLCRTDYGLCRLGIGISPGTPCYCYAYNGVAYPGVCVR
jgi:hypothetical protein